MTRAITKLTPHDVIAALGLPEGAAVNQRIPKKLLAENGAATAADRRLIQDHIEEATWVAALKPVNAGVAEYQDDQRSYLELAVVSVALRGLDTQDTRLQKTKRIAELMHRAIPYPIVLLLEDGQALLLSLAHIRRAQREAEKTVLDGDLITTTLSTASACNGKSSDASQDILAMLLASLALNKQPRDHLYALYQGWIDTLWAWQAAEVSNRFEISQSPEQAAERRAALRRCRELDAQIANLRNKARKEKQMARQIAANIEIKALLAERQQIVSHI